MTELSRSLAKLICVVTVKTGEDGKMFGTVTSGMIADQLKTQFDVTLDKRKIHLEHPLRAVGDHEVELRLHQDVVTTLKVRLESSTPPPAIAVAPASEAKKDDSKTEKRGRRIERSGERAEPGQARERAPKGEKPVKVEKPVKAERPPKAEKASKTTKSE
jgi:large subunit ribosomal protein L9